MSTESNSGPEKPSAKSRASARTSAVSHEQEKANPHPVDEDSGGRAAKPESAAERLQKLLEVAKDAQRAVVFSHDNPDPDSIASAIGIGHLLENLAKIPTTVAYGGLIGRAENRAMVKVLGIELVPVSRIVLDDFDLIGLVDTQPEYGNHSILPRYPVDIVIDHHPERPSSRRAAFSDVGGKYGATATVVASYLQASGLKLDTKLATALFYGIKSDTRDLGREYFFQDVELYRWLFPQIDHQALSQIEHPEVPVHYFAALHRAIGAARQHGEAVLADLGEVYAPDIVAEVAERLVSLEKTRWSLAIGEFEGHLYFSVRTADRRMNAGRLVRAALADFNGSAGGHGSMAGGKVPLFRRLPDGDSPSSSLQYFSGEEIGDGKNSASWKAPSKPKGKRHKEASTPQEIVRKRPEKLQKGTASPRKNSGSRQKPAAAYPGSGSVPMSPGERRALKRQLRAAFLREFNAPGRGVPLV